MTRRHSRKFYFLVLAVLIATTICADHVRLYPPHPPPSLALRLLDVSKWHWPEESFECVPYVVQWDDYSIWSIAAKLYSGKHIDRMVWAIRRASGREGADGVIVHRGDILWVPDPALYGTPKHKSALQAR